MRFEFSGKRWERRVAQKASKNHIGWPKAAPIEPDWISRSRQAWNTVGFVPMGRKAEDNADSLRLEVQALTDFRCSNKIEVLNGAQLGE